MISGRLISGSLISRKLIRRYFDRLRIVLKLIFFCGFRDLGLFIRNNANFLQNRAFLGAMIAIEKVMNDGILSLLSSS